VEALDTAPARDWIEPLARTSLANGPRPTTPTAASSATAAAYSSRDRFSLRHCSDRHAAEQYLRDDREPSGNGNPQFAHPAPRHDAPPHHSHSESPTMAFA
jgi:hypothetical protein